MKDNINLRRLELLIRGEQPKGLHEELFVLAYKAGIGEELLMLTLLQVSDIFDKLTKNEVNHFLLGYSLGQKTHRESEEEMLKALTNHKNKSFH